MDPILARCGYRCDLGCHKLKTRMDIVEEMPLQASRRQRRRLPPLLSTLSQPSGPHQDQHRVLQEWTVGLLRRAHIHLARGL